MSNNDAGSNESSGIECPTCENSFKSEHGMKIHHAKTHGESISGNPLECQNCGEEFRSWDSSRKYCSPGCASEGRKEREVRECPVCGEEFRTSKKPSRARKACSDSCSWELKGMTELEKRVTLTCPQCGDGFDVKPSHVDDRVCCSIECRSDMYAEMYSGPQSPYAKEWTTHTCKYCEEDYKVTPSRSDRTRFCSKECQFQWASKNLVGEDAPHYKGGTFPYGEGWTDKRKREVREHYGYKCVDCGMTQEEHLDKVGRRLEVHHIEKARDVIDEERRNSKDNLVSLCHTCHLSKWELMSPLRPQFDE